MTCHFRAQHFFRLLLLRTHCVSVYRCVYSHFSVERCSPSFYFCLCIRCNIRLFFIDNVFQTVKMRIILGRLLKIHAFHYRLFSSGLFVLFFFSLLPSVRTEEHTQAHSTHTCVAIWCAQCRHSTFLHLNKREKIHRFRFADRTFSNWKHFVTKNF